MSAVSLLAFPMGCGDQSTERKGGGEIPDLSGGGSSVDPAEGGATGADLVTWCEAYEVINCVCQQCHQNPTRNGAAMPLMTYEDTQARFPSATSSTFVWQQMQTAVSNGFMPETGNPSVVPPVKPLTDAQRATLLGWLSQGAHDEGGRDCPKTCDWSQ
jgi:hypothetical protein